MWQDDGTENVGRPRRHHVGSLSIGGTVVNNVLPKDRDVAMVFQNYALYPHMTVAQNMGFALKIRGQSKAEVAKKVGEAAAILRLTSTSTVDRSALGGQRQRVAMDARSCEVRRPS